jgi:hypothetical protein
MNSRPVLLAWLLGSMACASAGTRPGASMVQTRPPFDASRMRTGHFLYRTVHRGKDAGTSNISVVRLDERTYRFRNEVTGAFRQTWESTATSSFEPLSANLGLGENDEKSISMKLTYDGQAVTGTATKIDPVEGRRTNAVSAHIPFDTVDQRIDWAAMVSSPLTPGQEIFFSVYDPWTGVSPVSGRISDAEQVRVPAGEFDAYRVIYRIEKSRGVEQYEIWVSVESPHFLVREAFPNGSVTELTQVTLSLRNTAK